VSKGVVGSILGVAVVALALLVSGCGGSDDEPEALSKAQFVKQASAICQEGEKERGKLVEEFGQKAAGKKITVEDQEELVLAALPTYEKTTTGLSELGAPEKDEEKVAAIIEAREEAVENVESNPGTAVVGSIPFKKANDLAKDYGLTACTV
jgi:hypothetical protein